MIDDSHSIPSTGNLIRPIFMLQLAEFMEPYKDAFFTLHRLIIIALTIPVRTASCERSFSIMRQIKSYLRNSMGDERLSNLAVLSIESKIAKGLDMDYRYIMLLRNSMVRIITQS